LRSGSESVILIAKRGSERVILERRFMFVGAIVVSMFID